MTRYLLHIAAVALAASAVMMSVSVAASHNVRFAEEELASAPGVQAVYERIENAARKSCEDKYGRSAIVHKAAAISRCVREAINDAVLEIGNENLKAFHVAQQA